MALNRGEWSEFLAVLDLLSNPKITLVDSNMSILDNSTFELKNIRLYTNGQVYTISRAENTVLVTKDREITSIDVKDIEKCKNILLDKIIHNSLRDGAFNIPEMQPLIQKLNNSNVIKSKSGSKSDLDTDMLDNIAKKVINLKYSIKSQIGSPATILNASNKTNIRYRVENLDKNKIEMINGISTRNKLVDRLKKIYECDGKVVFDDIVDDVFKNNLKMIDSLMPEIIADICLRAYTEENKNLIDLFKSSEYINNDLLARKKLVDLLKGFSFDIKPGTIWQGDYDVNGGIIIISRDGNLYILDLIYHQNEVEEYLVKNTKLDSPSSTRYKMLELYEENGKIYFTLNLQIRFKQ